MANTDELIRGAIRNGEDYLQCQMQIALAADQRSVSLGGILTAAASVVLGFLFTGAARLPVTSILCLVLAGGLGVAAALAFYAARPVPMRTIGNMPSNWYEDIEHEKALAEALTDEMYFIDKGIRENTAIIDGNADFLKWSMGTAAATLGLVALLSIGAALTPYLMWL